MDSGQVSNELLSSSSLVVTIETEWKLPGLHLTATVGIVFTWGEPVMWFIKLDVSKERNLVDWSLGQSFNSDLILWAIDLKGESLSNITSVGPDELLLITTIMSLSSMSWWQNTDFVRLEHIIGIGPFPCLNFSASINA